MVGSKKENRKSAKSSSLPRNPCKGNLPPVGLGQQWSPAGLSFGASRCPQTCVSPSQMARPNWNAFATVIKGLLPQAIADLIAIIRAKDDLICQLKTAALETDRLRDRVEQLEQLVGVDRSLTSRLRT